MHLKSRWFEHAGHTYEARADNSGFDSCVEVGIFDGQGRPCDMTYPGGLPGHVNFAVYFNRALPADNEAVIDAVIAQALALFQAGAQ